MRRRDSFLLVLCVLLGLFVLGRATGIARHFQEGGRLRLELGRVSLTRLGERTRARLEGLTAKVLVTYYVSAPEKMPSEMRRLEAEVTDLLAAMRAAAPERFDFQIVDPDTSPDLEDFAARRRISPFRVRSIQRDAWSERKVWSTLSIAYGAHAPAQLHGVTPEQLPRLQATLLTWLDQLDAPRPARIALAAPGGFSGLARALALRGELLGVDLDGGARLPRCDLLVWMRPTRVEPALLAELDRHLAGGGSLLLAGGALDADAEGLRALEDGPGLLVRSSGVPVDRLYPHFGLVPTPGLLLDQRSDRLGFQDETHDAPFLIRCIAPNQDFQGFASQPNGTLLFTAPSVFQTDNALLRERGRRARVLATTSEESWFVPAPTEAPLSLAAMVPGGTFLPKQTLAVELRPEDPWEGRVFAFGADTPFRDGLFERDNVAHRRLLDVLLGETLSDERLVLRDADVARPAPLPELTPLERNLWRALAVGLLPLGLAWIGWRRGPLRELVAGLSSRAGQLRRLAPYVLIVLGLVLLRAAAGAVPLAFDATTGADNTLDPETLRLARAAGELGPIEVELLVSARARLPLALRPWITTLDHRLRDLERAGADLVVRRPPPEELEGAGPQPFANLAEDDEVTTFQRYWCHLRLRRDGRELVLPLPDVRAFETLEYHLAFALWRLAGHAAPVVGFASDLPRLSAAENHEYFQTRGLFAPKGTDVFSLARETLRRQGLDVRHVNPREPDLPDDLDALVWLQPRRPMEAMLEQSLRYLHGGGSLFLAAQQYEIDTRQYRGSGFGVNLWPRPLKPDLEALYFPELSIELAPEVLFDELSVTRDVDSTLSGRGAERTVERQQSTLPMQLRISAASFADHPLMRNLGDQSFPWSSFLRWDDQRLAALGLRATTLATTSPRSWHYAWAGGWIPEPLLAGPAELEGATAEFQGRLPVAALFEGTFPRPQAPLALGAEAEEAGAADTDAPWPAPAAGRLVFLADSACLRDEDLLDPVFRGDQLLWNVVAELALPPDLARVATRRQARQGFGYVTPESRLRWRATVLGLGPAALGLLALVRVLVRRLGARPRL